MPGVWQVVNEFELLLEAKLLLFLLVSSLLLPFLLRKSDLTGLSLISHANGNWNQIHYLQGGGELTRRQPKESIIFLQLLSF